MVEFAWQPVFWLAPLPLLVWLLVPAAPGRTGQALRVPFYNSVNQGGAGIGRRLGQLVMPLLMLVLWALVLAATARPQWIGEPIALPVAGRDLMLAVDLSGSMELADLSLNGEQATRLEVVKVVGDEFIQARVGDRLGLILFGERAYVQTPLSFDRTTVAQMLKESEIGLAGKATAIGDAIGLAVKKLRQQPEADKVLILLTDGANTAGEVSPLQAADLAAEEGLKIYTIGIGADEMEVGLGRGGFIAPLFGTRRVNPSTDLDEDTLKHIADVSGGRYFRARNTEGLREIYQEINRIEPMQKDVEYFRPRRELFFWPLGAALVLTVLMALGRELADLRARRQAAKQDDTGSPLAPAGSS